MHDSVQMLLQTLSKGQFLSKNYLSVVLKAYCGLVSLGAISVRKILE